MLMIKLTVIDEIVNVLNPEANLTNFCADYYIVLRVFLLFVYSIY